MALDCPKVEGPAIYIWENKFAGGGKCPKWKLSFGGFCGDNMGKMGPKTQDIWGVYLQRNPPPSAIEVFKF